jgi:thioredoxin 2
MNQAADPQIVHCPQCGAANRVPAERRGSPGTKCGKCKARLFPEKPAAGAATTYKMRCAQCGARNRVPADRVGSGAKCGKCGAPLKTDELFTPQPVMVTDANFEPQVLKSPLPVLLFAWAPWCSTCMAVSPNIEQFASESKGRVRVGKLNIDANPNLANRFSIMSVPFLFIFDNGELKESLPGALQKHELMLKMAHYV